LRGAWIFRSRRVFLSQRRNGSSSTISWAMPQIAPAVRSVRASSRVWVSASAVPSLYVLNLPRQNHAERPRHPGLDAEAVPCDWCLPWIAHTIPLHQESSSDQCAGDVITEAFAQLAASAPSTALRGAASVRDQWGSSPAQLRPGIPLRPCGTVRCRDFP
jgi:hypothetical protein